MAHTLVTDQMVFIIGHGSRVPEAVAQFHQFAGTTSTERRYG
jgi:sirohydrochlorin ferrochelatase